MYILFHLSFQTLIQMKDREQLVAISSKLTKHSRPWLTAEDALRSSVSS